MKILAHRESLLSALQAVWGVVPSRSPKPILQNVKIDASADEGTTLTATDLETGLIRRVAGVKVDRPGAAILSARVLEIAKSSSDEELSIETTEGGLRVRGLRADFKLAADDPDLFPAVAGFDASDYYQVASADLRRAIRRTVFAIDEAASTNFALGGLLWNFRNGELTIVGTNGRCLAESRIGYSTEGGPPDLINGGENPAPVLPGKALKLLSRLLADDETPVHISVKPNTHALIWADDLTIYSRLVAGRFPRYQDVIPARAAQCVTVPARAMLDGISQAKIVTSEDSRGVDFDFRPDGLTLSSQAADMGAATIELPLALGGEPLGVTLDPSYIEPMLRVLDDDQEMIIDLIDAKNAIVFNVGEDYRFVAMPMTRDR